MIHPVLMVYGLTDETTPLLELVTVCSGCQFKVSATPFDARDFLAPARKGLDAAATLAAIAGTADGSAFLDHAEHAHGVAKADLGPPMVVVL